MRLGDLDALRKNMEFICMGIMAGTEPYNAPLTEIDNAPTVEINTNDFALCKAYCRGLEDGKKIARPQGEWINLMSKEGYVECPFCGKQITGGDLNFCVKCGADMRKGGAE